MNFIINSNSLGPSVTCKDSQLIKRYVDSSTDRVLRNSSSIRWACDKDVISNIIKKLNQTQ